MTEPALRRTVIGNQNWQILQMKLITYNIQFARGLDRRIDYDRIAETVLGADVIAMQEVERYFPRTGNADQVRELTARLGGYHWVYGAGVDLDADETLEDGGIAHRRQQFGNLLLSKTPILTSRNHFLPKYGSIGPLSIQRTAVEGVIAFGNRTIRLYSIHLTHISAVERLQQVERLLQLHQDSVLEGAPIAGDPGGTDFARQGGNSPLPGEAILMGDFNFSPDSKEYSRIVGPKSDYGGRVVNPTGFVDAWVHAGNDEMDGVTAERRGVPVRMDFCFVSAPLADRIVSVEIDSSADGSDHKPVSMVLQE